MENLAIGARCTLTYCNQKDYLPFACKLCGELFCHDHMGDHECKRKDADNNFGIKCPDCLQTIKYTGADNASAVLEAHRSQPTCTKKAPVKSKKCISCYTKLTPINEHTCVSCGAHTCLKHRVSDLHACRPTLHANNAHRRLVAAY